MPPEKAPARFQAAQKVVSLALLIVGLAGLLVLALLFGG